MVLGTFEKLPILKGFIYFITLREERLLWLKETVYL